MFILFNWRTLRGVAVLTVSRHLYLSKSTCKTGGMRSSCSPCRVVEDLPQLSELAKCLMVDLACVSNLEMVAPTSPPGP